MQNVKKHIERKIHDIDQMLNELILDEVNDETTTEEQPKIDINQLDVVDVLHNILN